MAVQPSKRFQVTVPTRDLVEFFESCGENGWYVEDTGERVATDEGFDSEAVVVVNVLARQRQDAKRVTIQH